ncbi:hypothetical protein EAH81_11215 [Flavobacterium pectinovorum]|jgi:hypothetical protein|uniref:Uncharacterized protein n=1 Tax=Flavobacterium pectinovorum TaxID=29533 RepID=A0A502EUW9_9FLAO|nr:hypothetical protein EAH81_11215 [Flavobacterium pectinovorum]
MFVTLTPNQVHFRYGKNQWQYTFDEIAELGISRKKKTYFFVNTLFILVTAIAYYCMIFSDIIEVYYIIPTLLCYTFLIILRFNDRAEFEYSVLVRDIYEKETTIKIKAEDRNLIGRQIDQYLTLQFDRMIKKTA